jgi:hypothetical protein
MRRKRVDGSRFDELTQRLASIRLTRGGALRGLAVSAVTLTGIAKVADEASAGKKRRYCACEDENDNECTTERAGKRARRRYLRDHQCSYKGACRGSGSHNPCQAGAPITVNVNVLNLIGNECDDQSDCGGSGSGLECLEVSGIDICVPLEGGGLGAVCSEDSDCATGRCVLLLCTACDTADICGRDDNAQCCFADAECLGGLCLFPEE